MHIHFDKKSVSKSAMWLSVLIVTIVVIFLTATLINHAEKNRENAIASKKVSTSKGIVGATQFTQTVYDTYLHEAYGNELDFIKSHQTWFVKRSFDRPLVKGSVLFCQPLAHKPDRFKALSSVLSQDKKSATVYLQAFLDNKLILNNQPILLVAADSSWVVSGPSCYLD